MFESADLVHEVSKEDYRREATRLRSDLLAAQLDLSKNGAFPLLIVIGGVDGAGKGETVNILNEWMDPRHIHTHAFPEPSDEERERPRMWRFWRALPPKGKVGILFGAWHTDPILARVAGGTTEAELEESISEIRRFEKMLSDEGVLLLKFWFHLSKQQQKKRLRALEKDPKTRWRVTDTDWKRFERYDEFRSVSESFIRQTSSGEAPWFAVPGADPGYRSLMVGRQILAALRERLDEKTASKAPERVPRLAPQPHTLDVIRKLDMRQAVPRREYDKDLEKFQGRLNLLSRDKKFRKLSVVAVFEGNDAAGKGGAIRRVTAALDARHYRVVPVAAPTEEERAQPYLWRFWRHLPRRGRFTLFDRSWYGRVLVERVEGFCGEGDWMRAYTEITDFEAELTESRIVVAKFWLAISKAEQLRRFKERERVDFKRFKITEEDWRNRKKWSAYEAAVCDMVERTSTELAPWTLVEANDKYHARLKILRTLCRAVERGLDSV